LPPSVSFSVDASAIRSLLDSLGVASSLSDATSALHPVDLTRQASAMTVLVGCWD
jgi:hypothetical protein